MGLLSSLYAKLIGAGLLLALLAAGYAFAHHQGAASVQAKWDAAKAVNAAAVAEAQLHADAVATAQRDNFNALSAKYEAAIHVQVPTIAGTIPADLAAGTLRLRDPTVCPSSGNVTAATARSRALDAASTQALADRVQAAVAAVRVGDESDARERLLGAQVTALQGVLTAERAVH